MALNLGSERTILDYTTETGLYVSPFQSLVPNQTGLIVFLTVQAAGVPPAPTLFETSGGALAAANYYVKTTYVLNGEEGPPSIENHTATLANYLLGVISPPPLGSVNGYNVYVGTTPGSETLQTFSGPQPIGSNWIEPTSGLVTGVSPPGSSNGLLLEIDGLDLESNAVIFPILLSSNPILSAGKYGFGIGPLLWNSVGSNGVVQGAQVPLPDKWQVKVYPLSNTDGTPYLYSVSYIPF